MTHKIFLILPYFLLLFTPVLFCQSSKNPIPDKMMQGIYNQIKTPHKYGLVMAPPDGSTKMESPGVFRRGNLWYMVYTVADAFGYETWLAQSSDLLSWKEKGRMLSVKSTTEWDRSRKIGTIALQDIDWEGSYEWQKFNNRYWMSYAGSNVPRAAPGPFSIGMSYSYQDPSGAREWLRPAEAVLSPFDSNSRWSDNITMSRSFVLRDNQQFTGHTFVMYYSARGDSISRSGGVGSINMAVSDDMIRWQRYGNGPVINHNSGITGDPVIQKVDNLYVMFYYGDTWKVRKEPGAFVRFACSYDLINWTDWSGPDLINSSEPYEESHIHKSSVIKYKGVVYHFYSAVDKNGQQGIALATSTNTGKSSLSFTE